MADHSDEVVSGEANQQAFATSRTTDQLAEDDQDIPPGRGGLVLAALGVVCGAAALIVATKWLRRGRPELPLPP